MTMLDMTKKQQMIASRPQVGEDGVPIEYREVDYLVIGAGIAGVACYDSFAEGLKSEGKQLDGVKTLMIDENPAPGGHWNWAYPFVQLHAPSANYGVESEELNPMLKELGDTFAEQIQSKEFRKAIMHRSSKRELVEYFAKVVKKFGRENSAFEFSPCSQYKNFVDPTTREVGEAEDFVHVIEVYDGVNRKNNMGAVTAKNGTTTAKLLKRLHVTVVKKIIHGSVSSVSVPSLAPRRFSDGDCESVIPVNALACDTCADITGIDTSEKEAYYRALRDDIKAGRRRVIVVGGGKTGQDAINELVGLNPLSPEHYEVSPENIAFVCDNAYTLARSVVPAPMVLFSNDPQNIALTLDNDAHVKTLRETFEYIDDNELGVRRFDKTSEGAYYHSAVTSEEEQATVKQLRKLGNLHEKIYVKEIVDGGNRAKVQDKKSKEMREISFFTDDNQFELPPVIVDCTAGVSDMRPTDRKFLYGKRVLITNSLMVPIPATGQFPVSPAVLGKLLSMDSITEEQKIRMSRSIMFGGTTFTADCKDKLRLGHINGLLNMRDWLNAGLAPWMDSCRMFVLCGCGFGPMKWAMTAMRFNETMLPAFKKHPEVFDEGAEEVANPNNLRKVWQEIREAGGMHLIRKNAMTEAQFPIPGLSFPFAEIPNKHLLEHSPMLREMVELGLNKKWHPDLARLSKEAGFAEEKMWFQLLAASLKPQITAGVKAMIVENVKYWGACVLTLGIAALFMDKP